MEAGVESVRGAFEGVAGEIDRAAGRPTPERGPSADVARLRHESISCGIAEQVLAVKLGHDQGEQWVHPGVLRFGRPPRSAGAV